MMGKKRRQLSRTQSITRADLADAVYRTVGLSRSYAAQLVDMVLTDISNAIARGEPVKLSAFGSFSIHSKSGSVGRNPKTGVEALIIPRRVVVFKPSQALREAVNKGGERVGVEDR
jgi:integration host factor subunit alpha